MINQESETVFFQKQGLNLKASTVERNAYHVYTFTLLQKRFS